jgi:hypothetical protein
MVKGIKYDTDKLRWDLMPWPALEQVLKVMMFGAKKYSEYNWQHVKPPMRYWSAAMRHMIADRNGKECDDETGLLHLAHAACDILFLMWQRMQARGEVDYELRYEPKNPGPPPGGVTFSKFSEIRNLFAPEVYAEIEDQIPSTGGCHTHRFRCECTYVVGMIFPYGTAADAEQEAYDNENAEEFFATR